MRLPSSLKLIAAIVPAVLAMSATPASADLNKWSGLMGLNAASGADWVREYAVSLPNKVYAATEGDGVYFSETFGAKWKPMTGLEGAARNVRTVFTSGNTVYAGTTAGLFKSTNDGAFQPVAQGPEEDPKNPKKLNGAVQAVFKGLAGQWLAGVASGGVYKSMDNGATWKPPAPNNGMPKSETVWSFGSFADGLIYAATQSGIYISTNFGSSWTLSNDGITGVTLRAFADDKNANIYYAAGTDGVFRSITAGLTWSKIDGPPSHRLPDTTVRAMKQFSGDTDTRLFVGTDGKGVWSGTTGHGPIPGEVKWRQVELDGFGNDTIVWALAGFPNTPGTLLSGNKANGGYALTFQLPSNDVIPSISGTPQVGKTLTANPGEWSGTETIDYEYQWQNCTSASESSCDDINGAENQSYVVDDTDQSDRIRVVVTASNDVPTFGLVKEESNISAVVAAKAGTVAGSTSAPAPGITVTGDQSGDVVTAKDPLFNPVATLGFTFQWFRCNDTGGDCQPMVGAVGRNYTLTNADIGSKICATATGYAAGGGTTSGCGAKTNIVLAPNPVQTAPTTMLGKAQVGEVLVSGVGAWAFEGTTFSRQWEACNPDGSSCATITGAKSPTYMVKADDLGKRLRVRIGADTNEANKLPNPKEVFTPLSGVVIAAPAGPQNPQPTPTPQGGEPTPQPTPSPQPTPQPTPSPTPDTVAPVLGLKAVSSKLKPNTALQLKATLSEGASLSVRYERKVSGRKVGKTCKAGAKKGKKCTTYKKLATVAVSGMGGSSTVTLPKRKLAAGDYRVVVTPVDAAGNKGAAKTVSFKVLKKKKK